MESYRTPVAPPRPSESEIRFNGEDRNARFAQQQYQAQQQHQARQRQEIQSSVLRGPARPSRPVGASSPLSSPLSALNGAGLSGSGSGPIRPLTPAEMLVRDIDDVTKKRISEQLRVLQNVEQMTRRAIAELQSVQGRLFIPPGETVEGINRPVEDVPATTISREPQAASSTTGLNSGVSPSSTSTRQGHERETSDDSLVEVGVEEGLEDVKDTDTGTEGSAQRSEDAASELPYYSC
jgi:hypothetical protein